MIDPGREGRIAKTLLWGAVLAIVGFGALIAVLLIGLVSLASPLNGDPTVALMTGLPIAVFALGVVLLGVGFYQMWAVPRKAAASTDVTEAPGVLILSKFAIDRNGLMQFPADLDQDLVDDQGFKLYVRVEFADGRKGEFRTSLWTYQTIGEGMKGTLRIQGDWVGQFVPAPHRPEDSAPALRG